MGTNETATILSIFFPVSKQPIFERNKRIIQVIIILSLNTKTTKPLRANKENNRGKHFPKQIQAAFSPISSFPQAAPSTPVDMMVMQSKGKNPTTFCLVSMW